jgi:60S ribosomal subunit assembly/export protein LOC1
LALALDAGVGKWDPSSADLKKFQPPRALLQAHLHNEHTAPTMAPTKPSSKGKSGPKGKSGASKPRKGGKEPEGISKRKQKSLSLAKPGGEQKSKSFTSKTKDGRKKKRVYTEAELDIPKLNSIVPAGIAKPKGQKKGKVFVDDPASMMAIMSVVNAQKEGHIESKIMRARQLEEIREAKRKEAEGRAEEKKADFVSFNDWKVGWAVANRCAGGEETEPQEEEKEELGACARRRRRGRVTEEIDQEGWKVQA